MVLRHLFPLGLNGRYALHEFAQPNELISVDRPIFEGIERAVPASALSRAWNFTRMGTSMFAHSLKSSWQEGGSLREHALSPGNVETLTEGLLKMRGAALKLGQFLSFQQSEALPPSFFQALERTRREAYIMPKAQLERTMTASLGKDWLRLFDSFEATPFAAASIGQVHKAVYRGQKVAVKVQYPGIDQSIASDLNTLKRLVRWTNMLPKGIHFDALADHIKED